MSGVIFAKSSAANSGRLLKAPLRLFKASRLGVDRSQIVQRNDQAGCSFPQSFKQMQRLVVQFGGFFVAALVVPKYSQIV